MPKNAIVSKVIGTVAAGVILLILAILLKWGPSIQSNTYASQMNEKEIIRVDKKVDMYIMEQKAFRDDTTEKLHAIDKGVLRIEERLKAHNP